MNASKFALPLLATLVHVASPALAAPILGSNLASFTVLGATTVTNVPTSSIAGNVGVWQSGGANAVTGFASAPGVAVSDVQVTAGAVHAGTETGTPNAMAAQVELTRARGHLASLGPGTALSDADLSLAGTLLPGVYSVPAGTTNLSGAVTLDGEGNANAAWVFQMDTLITSPDSVVNVINTGSGAGVFWNVASSATIDGGTTFLGNILALASISMNGAATNVCGRALADTGAVTLIQNSLSGDCAGILAGSGGLSGGLDVITTAAGTAEAVFLPGVPVGPGTPGAGVPEPASLLLVAAGLAGLYGARKRFSIGA